MANVDVRKADGTTVYFKAAGAGSSGDPHIPEHTVSALVPGVAATSLGKAEDAAHSSGDTGVMLLAVREAAATDLSAGNTDGDYEPLQVDASGRLWTNVGAVTPGTAAGNLGKAEDGAHTSGDTGVMALGVRNDADAAFSGTDADYTPLATDSAGRLKVNSVDEWVVLDVTPTCDTSANDAGDVLFDTVTCGTVARANGGVVTLDSVRVLDEDDQTAAALTLYFLDTNTSLGTVNAAPNISDANARKILGTVPVASEDWVDVGGAKVATVRNVGLTMKADAASQIIYVAGTCAGTPTQTASGIKLKLAFKRS